MKAASLAAAKVIPSVLAAGESGAIGAASIAAQLKAAEREQVAAANAAALEKQRLQNAAKAEGLAKRYGYMSAGGMVKPKYFSVGGAARGTDIVPAMLTPGEFVINKNAANSIGTNNLNKLNNGQSMGNSVYNYSVGINVSNSNANSEDIARAVIGQIKYIDSQRIRGQR